VISRKHQHGARPHILIARGGKRVRDRRQLRTDSRPRRSGGRAPCWCSAISPKPMKRTKPCATKAALIQTILNTVVDGIITVRASSGVFETVNPAAERMFGYSAQ